LQKDDAHYRGLSRHGSECRLIFHRQNPVVAKLATYVQTIAVVVCALSLSVNSIRGAESKRGQLLAARHTVSPARLAEDAMRFLQANCLGCHNAEKHKGGLELTSRDALLKGGDGGAVILPGKPEQSALFKALAPDADPHMPPKKQLSTNQIALVRKWIAAGAPWE
jgi:mono/diheme cytochrome c family protein